MFYIGLVLIFALVAQKETIGDISEHILQSLSRVNPHRYTIIYPKNNISLQLKNIFPIVQCRSRKYKDIFTNPVIEYQNINISYFFYFTIEQQNLPYNKKTKMRIVKKSQTAFFKITNLTLVSQQDGSYSLN